MLLFRGLRRRWTVRFLVVASLSSALLTVIALQAQQLNRNSFRQEPAKHQFPTEKQQSDLKQDMALASNTSFTTHAKQSHTSSLATSRHVPEWQRRLFSKTKQPSADSTNQTSSQKHYFLTTVVRVRIYADDKAKWTVAELKQWLHYLFWAGVEHVYLCNHFLDDSESLAGPLQRYIDLGLLTVLPWNNFLAVKGAKDFGETNKQNHVSCLDHVVTTYRQQSEWQVSIDMDEYPYCPQDQSEGFLRNYLKNSPEDISVVVMKNYVMLGQGNRSRALTIERINRMTPKPINNLVKVVYRTNSVVSIHRHGVSVNKGKKTIARDDQLRFLHYWGARMQDWGPDTPDIIAMTIEFNAARDNIGRRLRDSLLNFNETDAFSTNTGP